MLTGFQKMVRSRGLEPPRDYSRCHLKAVRLPIPPRPRSVSAKLLRPFYFFGGACGGVGFAFGFGGMFKGIVSDAPVLGLLSVTEGCPGFTPPVAGVIDTGAPGTIPGGSVVVLGCFVEVAGCLSRIVFPTPVPERRVARIESESEVTMNRTAEAVVALDSSVADPRGPNAVCEPIPPNAPAKSAAFPLCKSTTTIRKRQIKTCKIVSNVYTI
jgi:hypothetical protein